MVPVLVVAGVSTVLAATALDGAPGGLAAAAGIALTVLVVGFGMALTSAVARISPAASLLVALLTYALQLLVLLVVLTAVERSELLEGALHREWLGGSIIGGAVLWTVALTLYHIRAGAGESSSAGDHTGGPGGRTPG